MTVADGSWGGLPAEIVEQVLAFLLAPDLCRCRAVCKEWNRLICEPQFAARCIQNTNASDAPFIVVRYNLSQEMKYNRDYDRACSELPHDGPDFEQGVHIFDVMARRWYKILGYECERRAPFDCEDFLVGADGGLVCQFRPSELKSFHVYNPVSHTRDWVHWPELTCKQKCFRGNINPLMDMAVDMMTQNYKIFLIDRKPLLGDSFSMLVYDSSTRVWVTSSQLPLQECREVVLCSLAYQDKLYILTDCDIGLADRKHRVRSYSISQDTWEEEVLEIHGRSFWDPQLIGSANRSYLKDWSYLRKEEFDFQLVVLEILIPDRTCRKIFEMTNTLVLQVFFGGEVSINPDMDAFVCGNFIIIMAQLSGTMIMYDMTTRLWGLLPRNALGPPSATFGYRRCHCSGKQTNLIFPIA